MKRPIAITLSDNDDLDWDQDPMTTDVVFHGGDTNFVSFVHGDPEWGGPFALTRKEARQLRNFLNKCLEW